MGILTCRPTAKRCGLTALVFLFSVTRAHADTPPLVTGADGALNSSIGSGNIYSVGASLQLDFGSDDDESNRSGDLHLSYLNQLEPVDPTSPASGIKHDIDWVGGFDLSIWKRFSLGIDLDSLSDPTETLRTDGAKFVFGVEPLRFSYRLARNVIDTDFVFNPGESNQVDRYGAFIYQHTLGLEANFSVGKSNDLSFGAAYSFFEPDAQAFASLLTSASLIAISGFQDTLQSLEDWSTEAKWKLQCGKKWDGVAGIRLAHLIIPGISSYSSTFGAGYQVTEPVHIAVAWNYSDETTILVQNILQLELQYSWLPKSREEQEDEEDRKTVRSPLR